MTWVAGNVVTAAQGNTQWRDNLNQTVPALASAAGQIFVSTAANAIAARTPGDAYVATTQTLVSATYTDLATVGPQVTVTTGTQAMVALYGSLATGSGNAYMGYDITGASTIAVTDDRALATSTTTGIQIGALIKQTGLTAGSNIFTAKYRGGGTCTFAFRRLFVIPL